MICDVCVSTKQLGKADVITCTYHEPMDPIDTRLPNLISVFNVLLVLVVLILFINEHAYTSSVYNMYYFEVHDTV